MKNAHIGNVMKNVPHTKYSNDFFILRDFMYICKAKNEPNANAHLIDVNVNGYLKIYFAFK